MYICMSTYLSWTCWRLPDVPVSILHRSITASFKLPAAAPAISSLDLHTREGGYLFKEIGITTHRGCKTITRHLLSCITPTQAGVMTELKFLCKLLTNNLCKFSQNFTREDTCPDVLALDLAADPGPRTGCVHHCVLRPLPLLRVPPAWQDSLLLLSLAVAPVMCSSSSAM
jgi:hypothetical protein